MVNINSKHLTFKSVENPIINSRMFPISIIVSKKVAKLAVDRNKIKRRLRGLFTTLETSKYNNSIIYTRKGVNKLTFSELKKEAQEILNTIK